MYLTARKLDGTYISGSYFRSLDEAKVEFEKFGIYPFSIFGESDFGNGFIELMYVEKKNV